MVDSRAEVVHNEIQSFPSVLSFFPEVKGDASRVVWAHDVTSKASLYDALRGINQVYSIWNFTTGFQKLESGGL